MRRTGTTAARVGTRPLDWAVPGVGALAAGSAAPRPPESPISRREGFPWDDVVAWGESEGIDWPRLRVLLVEPCDRLIASVLRYGVRNLVAIGDDPGRNDRLAGRFPIVRFRTGRGIRSRREVFDAIVPATLAAGWGLIGRLAGSGVVILVDRGVGGRGLAIRLADWERRGLEVEALLPIGADERALLLRKP